MWKAFITAAILWLPAAALHAEQVVVETPQTAMVIDVTKGQAPQFVYYGPRLSRQQLEQLQPAAVVGPDVCSAADPAIESANGPSTRLMVTGVERLKNDLNQITVVHLKDLQCPITVDLKLMQYHDVDMIEVWAEITHNEAKAVMLPAFASFLLPIRRSNVWMSSYGRSWGDEWQISDEPLFAGQRVIEPAPISPATYAPQVVFSLDGWPRPSGCRVIGAALCRPGGQRLPATTAAPSDYRLLVTTGDSSDYHYLTVAPCEDSSHYRLSKGEPLHTPHVALSFSTEGLSGVSRNFSKWGRKYKPQY